MTTFDPGDRATWPEVLTADEFAAVYRRKVGGVKADCARRTCVPAPFCFKPYKWRKTDILRHLDGALASLKRSA